MSVSSTGTPSPPIRQRILTIVDDIGVPIDVVLPSHNNNNPSASGAVSNSGSAAAHNNNNNNAATGTGPGTNNNNTESLFSATLNTSSGAAGTLSSTLTANLNEVQSRQLRLRQQVAKMFGTSKYLNNSRRRKSMVAGDQSSTTQPNKKGPPSEASSSVQKDDNNNNNNNNTDDKASHHEPTSPDRKVDFDATEEDKKKSAFTEALAKQNEHISKLKEKYGFSDKFLDLGNRQESAEVIVKAKNTQEEEQKEKDAQTQKEKEKEEEKAKEKVKKENSKKPSAVDEEEENDESVSPHQPKAGTARHSESRDNINDPTNKDNSDLLPVMKMDADPSSSSPAAADFPSADNNNNTTKVTGENESAASTKPNSPIAALPNVSMQTIRIHDHIEEWHFAPEICQIEDRWSITLRKNELPQTSESRNDSLYYYTKNGKRRRRRHHRSKYRQYCQILLSSKSAMVPEAVAGATSVRREFEEYQFRFGSLKRHQYAKEKEEGKLVDMLENQQQQGGNNNNNDDDNSNDSDDEDEDDEDEDENYKLENDGGFNDSSLQKVDLRPDSGLFMKKAVAIDSAFPYFIMDDDKMIRKDDGQEVSKHLSKGCSGLPLYSCAVTVSATIPKESIETLSDNANVNNTNNINNIVMNKIEGKIETAKISEKNNTTSAEDTSSPSPPPSLAEKSKPSVSSDDIKNENKNRNNSKKNKGGKGSKNSKKNEPDEPQKETDEHPEGSSTEDDNTDETSPGAPQKKTDLQCDEENRKSGKTDEKSSSSSSTKDPSTASKEEDKKMEKKIEETFPTEPTTMQTTTIVTTHNIVLGVLIGHLKNDKSKLVFLNIPALTSALRKAPDAPNNPRLCGSLRYFLDSTKVDFFTGEKKHIDTSDDEDDKKSSSSDDDDDTESDEDDDTIVAEMREKVDVQVKSVGGRPVEITDKLVSTELIFQNLTRKSEEANLYEDIVERILIEEKKSRFSSTSIDRECATQRLTALRQLARKLEVTVGVRHLMRDCMGNAKSYPLHCSWILNMICSFLMLLVLTCLNSHMLDLNFMMKPYIDASTGCFYESITTCCQPVPQPADKPQKTCLRNEEKFSDYTDRWLEFIFNRSDVGDCGGLVYAIGGGRIEQKITPENFLVISQWNKTADSSSATSPPSSPTTTTTSLASTKPYADLRQYFKNTFCPNSEVCQRFMLLNNLQAKKTWRKDSSFSVTVSYNVFIEAEWQMVDEKCRHNLRILPVPSVFEVDAPFVAGVVAASLIIVMCCFVFYVEWKNKRTTRLISFLRPRGNYMFYFAIWIFLIVSCVILGAVLAVWVAPSPYAFILLIIIACINLVFFLIHASRWFTLILREASTSTKENHDLTVTSWNNYLTEQILGWNIPNSFFINNWGGTTLLAYGGCCCFFIATAYRMYNVHVNSATSQDNPQLLEAFDTYASLRPFFRIIQIVYAPIGLELVMYFPNIMCTTGRFPRSSFILLLYIFVFMALSANDLLLPTTIGEVSSTVISFASQITTFLGPVDDVTGRMLDLIAGVLLIGVTLQVLDELDEEREEKPRRMLMALSWKNIKWTMALAPEWEKFPMIEPLFLDQRFSLSQPNQLMSSNSVVSFSKSNQASRANFEHSKSHPHYPNNNNNNNKNGTHSTESKENSSDDPNNTNHHHHQRSGSDEEEDPGSPLDQADESTEDREMGRCDNLRIWYDCSRPGVPISPKIVHLLASIIRRSCYQKDLHTLVLCPHHVRILAGQDSYSPSNAINGNINDNSSGGASHAEKEIMKKAVLNFVRNQVRIGKYNRICGIFAVQDEYQQNQIVSPSSPGLNNNSVGSPANNNNASTSSPAGGNSSSPGLVSKVISSALADYQQQQEEIPGFSSRATYRFYAFSLELDPEPGQPRQIKIYQSSKLKGVSKSQEHQNYNAVQRLLEERYPMIGMFMANFVRNKTDGLGLKVRLNESFDISPEQNLNLRESGLKSINKLVDLCIPYHGAGLLTRQRFKTLIKLYKRDPEQISANVSKIMFSE